MDDHVATHLPAEAPLARTTLAPRRRLRLRLGWLVGLLALLAVGFFVWRAFAPAPQGTTVKTLPQPVGIAPVGRGDIRILRDALGTVTPLATVTVRTQINGQLMTVGFTEGQTVHKGDFLAQIDPRPYQALLDQYEGQLARDQALLKQAQTDLVRYQTLLRQDSIARQQAEDQVFLVQQDAAAIRSDQAQIDAQQLNLTYCRITSPVDGRVGLRQIDPGNFVQTSDANGLVVVTQLQPISVIFPLPEDDIPTVLGRLHTGAKLSVTAYDRANVTALATGEVATIDNEVDTTTGTWKLRAVFPNADETLFPNQFVNIHLLVDTLHDVVTVPTAAVQRGAPGTYVYLLGAGNTVSVRPIKTGPADGDRVQVVSGLAAGDRVVIDGTDRLRDGAKVSVQEGGGPAASPGHAARQGSTQGSAPGAAAVPGPRQPGRQAPPATPQRGPTATP